MAASVGVTTGCTQTAYCTEAALRCMFGLGEAGHLLDTAPKTHCSDIIYIVKYFQPGDQLAMKVYAETERLAPGRNAQMRLNVPTKQVRIYARGVQSGCNQGRLASWSVAAEVGPLLN